MIADFLRNMKEQMLDEPFTTERSEIVERIDQWEGTLKLRCMTRTPQGWKKEMPDDVSAWLWKHDGSESVCIDDATHTYFCGTPAMLGTYRAAWDAERRVGDKRKAAMFYELDRQLFEQE